MNAHRGGFGHTNQLQSPFFICRPISKEFIEYDFPETRFNGALLSKMHDYKAPLSQEELVHEALKNPIGAPRLKVLAEGRKNVVIIASDHTRPVPSKIIIPAMISEIREGNPDAGGRLRTGRGDAFSRRGFDRDFERD